MPAPAKSPDKVLPAIERYFARVDERIANLSASESREFIAAQIERWTNNLVRFTAIVDGNKPMPAEFAGATVWDFHATLARLSALQSGCMEPSHA